MRFGSIAVIALLIATPSARAVRQPPAAQLQTRHLLEFDTDACGDLNHVATRRSTPKATSAPDPDDGDDEDEWVNAWNMSPEESVFLNDWLSQHPELAVVTNAIQKVCKDHEPPIDDTDDLGIA